MQKAASGNTRVAVNVLWTAPLIFPLSALRRIMLHPYMMGFLGLLLIVIILANEQPEMQHVPFVYRAMLYLLAVVAITALVVGWIIWRAFRAKGEMARINLTSVLVITHFSIIPIIDWLERILFLQAPFATLHLFVRILFYIAITLVGLAVLFSFFGSDISRDAVKVAAPPKPAPAPERTADPALPAPLPVTVPVPDNSPEIGPHNAPVDGLILMRAQSGKVAVVTLAGTAYAPGPLAERVAELPQGSGRFVHRHVWVRDSAVTGYRVKGRELTILLAGGHAVHAAVSRHDELLPWLRDVAGSAAG